MSKKRVELYRRLPEIYRIKDEDLPKLFLENGDAIPAFQLKRFLEPVEEMFGAIHENIESLYHDLFIEHCDEWVIPYIGDLLGTSHLAGDAWTRRADVADTIALRRRKGTLGAIELLAFILTKWGAHSVELRDNLVWNQHLNHQRPDAGGTPPYGDPAVRSAAPRRGGTVSLRDPSLLAEIGTPFDPFGHVADVRPGETGAVHYNLPNLAIYLWRLEDYRVERTRPRSMAVTPLAHPLATPGNPQAPRIVRVNVDPVPPNVFSQPYVFDDSPPPGANGLPEGRPVRLFNTNRMAIFARDEQANLGLDIASAAPRVSTADQVPGPIPRERISDFEIAAEFDASLASSTPKPLDYFTDLSFTAPQEYLRVDTDLNAQTADVGLHLIIPEAVFPGRMWPHVATPRGWTIRGENLEAWERGLNPPLAEKQIAIDPDRGRVAFGVLNNAQATALVNDLRVSYTYAAVGPVGAHPVSYDPLPAQFDPAPIRPVLRGNPATELQEVLRQALSGIEASVAGGGDPPPAIIIEIGDSRTHPLDLSALDVATRNNETGVSMLLNCPLIIRAADNQRPVIDLARPLAFRPARVTGADPAEQAVFDGRMNELFVRLEGLFVARGRAFPANQPLIRRAAVNRLEILSCTLDPGGFRRHLCDPQLERAPRLPAINLREPYGFSNAADELSFAQTPEIVIQRTVTGAVFTDEGYRLCVEDSIVESIPVNAAGKSHDLAIAAASGNNLQKLSRFACPLTFRNVTVLGRVRVATVDGAGGIFTGALEVFDQQTGCLKFTYLAPEKPVGATKNTVPPHYGCVWGDDAHLAFTSTFSNDPAYCQLALDCDRRILEEGVGDDQMGAFNFLREAHKWRNLRIRFREFMPVGVRPILVPVT